MARIKTHPGEILLEEFLNPMGISRNQLAKDIGIDAAAVYKIADCKRAITPEIAIRLAEYFGTSAELWLNLQTNHDLSKVLAEKGKEILRRVHKRPIERGRQSATAVG
jgi:addiction module HigA family antidote